MTPERHQQICDLLYEALELDSNERDSFLNRACSADLSLRREVDALLSSSEDLRSSFLRSSALRLTLAPGTKLGEYQVDSLVGSGGMGEVYRARDLRLARNVAIKVISSFLSSDRKQLWRFEQEARAAAALNHPNILAVFQMGTHDGVPYLVSELLEGETLRDHIKHGRIPLLRVVDFAAQTARGLAAAHERGVVHRDLKPENLFITADGRVKILDFGLAKLTHSLPSVDRGAKSSHQEIVRATEPGVVMGTVGYMSPEQATGQPADARSDIFSLGTVLYEMLTGRPAFQRATPADTISAILNQNPPAIVQVVGNVPVTLQRVVNRCLEKQPEQRFQSASDLLRALETLPTSHGSSIRKMLVFAIATLLVLTAFTQKKNLLDLMDRTFHTSSPAVVPSRLAERNLTANPPENPVRAAAISRDGKYVAYADDSKKVLLLLVDSGEVHQLPVDSAYGPADWFPDGVHLLMTRKHGQSGVWKFSTWDSSLRKLWDGPVYTISVSPNGSTIAFLKGNDPHEIWLMGGEGEEPHKILEAKTPDTLGALAWSPSGRRLAYIRLRGTFAKHETVIETCDLTGGDRVTVLSEPRLWGRDGVRGISWLADGRIIYSISTRLDEYNLWSIMVSPDRGGQNPTQQPITDWRDFAASDFQPTADGKRMIALKIHSEDGIYVGAVAKRRHGFNAKRLTADGWRNFATAWTKDSQSILLFSRRNGRYAICKQGINARMPETLIAGPENYRDPVLSGRGMLLYTAFASADVETSAGNWRLMSTPIEGGPRLVLMNGRYSYDCGSSPSSGCVVGDLKDNQLVFSSLDAAKGKGKEIARATDYHAATAHWSLSPEGTKIAVVDPRQEKGIIQILSLEDHRTVVLPVQGWRWDYLSSVGWAADGKGLFAIAQSESSAALVSIDANGLLTVLHEVGPEQAWLGMPIASPDGRFLAFTKRTYVSDLVMLENF